MTATNLWGIELNGEEADKQAWRSALKPPFDPYVEEVVGDTGSFVVLRSLIFDGIRAGAEANEAAASLFNQLNMAMGANFDTDPVTPGAVVDFSYDPPRRHHFLRAKGIVVRVRFGIATLTVTDANGNVIEPPVASASAQDWVRAASLHSGVAAAMKYLSGKPGWVDLYKAYEALHDSGHGEGTFSASEVRLFTRTANTEERHREDKFQSPTKPMTLGEGRAFMMTWLAASIREVLGTNAA